MSEKNLNMELSEQQLEDVAGGVINGFVYTTACPRCGLRFSEPVDVCPKCQTEIPSMVTATPLKARAL